MELIFATNNKHKVEEICALIKSTKVIPLSQAGINEDIPETGSTLQENALIKARYVYKRTGKACFADDTGLEVDALNGAPGVYSARYAGEGKNSEDNIDKLLDSLNSITHRDARFRCVIAYIDTNGNEYLFEGRVEGKILHKRQGTGGFGYDSVFMPNGYNVSFAQMATETKNTISHRGKAVKEFVDFMNKK